MRSQYKLSLHDMYTASNVPRYMYKAVGVDVKHPLLSLIDSSYTISYTISLPVTKTAISVYLSNCQHTLVWGLWRSGVTCLEAVDLVLTRILLWPESLYLICLFFPLFLQVFTPFYCSSLLIFLRRNLSSLFRYLLLACSAWKIVVPYIH